MEKYSRVLVIIFFLCLINLGFNLYIIYKLNNPVAQTVPVVQQPVVTRLPAQAGNPSPTTVATIPTTIQSDLTLIKAEIRALREILGTTKSFEELSNLIKTLNVTEP